MRRFSFVLDRLLQLLTVLFGVTLLDFFILRLMPGDAVLVMLGTHYTPHRAAILRTALGLDKPVWQQYLLFMSNVIHLKLGNSILYGLPVWTLITQRLPVTIGLVGYAGILAIVISVPIATVAAVRRGGVVDQISRVVFMVTAAMPTFWVGIILILVFSVHWQLFPLAGYGSSEIGHLRDLFLPSLTIALGFIAVFVRTLYNSILDVLQANYLDTARAKGLRRSRILWRHVLRNALLPLVTVLGVTLSYAIGSTVVVEDIFSLPGLGQLLTNSIYNRDLSVVQGVALTFAVFVVLVSLLTEVVYAALDPRIAYE
jgi:peptide/nickel transport system permease protein